MQKQNVGQTTRKQVEHTADIRLEKDKISGIHFNPLGHSLDNFRVQILEKVSPNHTNINI